MGTALVERKTSLPAFAKFDAESFSEIELLRRDAWNRAQELGIPTIREEEWKYTNLRDLNELENSETEGVAVSENDAKKLWLDSISQTRITFIDGEYSEEFSTPLTGIDGLEIRTLQCAMANKTEIVKEHLGILARLSDETFDVTAHLGVLKKEAVGAMAALNTATFRSGAYVFISKNACIELPVHLVNISTSKSYCAPRVLVIVEDGAEATLIESYVGIDAGAGLTNVVSEVFLGKNAKLEHIKIQEEREGRTHVALTECKQEADSTYLHYNIGFGALLARNDINVFLNGSNLHCRLDGVVAIDGSQHHDNHTRLDHAYPHCDSFEVYKQVLSGSATAVFNGKIFVHEDAQKTDAKQTNQTLLLSPTATINTKPQLEIFADDVKCTHGATIGRVRDEALFYARSRGIPFAEARALLVYAFAAEVIEKISNIELRKILEEKLFQKLSVTP